MLFTVATEGVAELQVPPAVAFESVTTEPAHTDTEPAGVIGVVDAVTTVIPKRSDVLPHEFVTV